MGRWQGNGVGHSPKTEITGVTREERVIRIEIDQPILRSIARPFASHADFVNTLIAAAKKKQP